MDADHSLPSFKISQVVIEGVAPTESQAPPTEPNTDVAFMIGIILGINTALNKLAGLENAESATSVLSGDAPNCKMDTSSEDDIIIVPTLKSLAANSVERARSTETTPILIQTLEMPKIGSMNVLSMCSEESSQALSMCSEESPQALSMCSEES